MDDLLFSLNTVFPLLVMMAVGFTARRVGVIGESAARQINACVFKIFLPLLPVLQYRGYAAGCLHGCPDAALCVHNHAFVLWRAVCRHAAPVPRPRLLRGADSGHRAQQLCHLRHSAGHDGRTPRGIPPSRCSWWQWWCRCSNWVLSTVALMVFGGEKGSPWRIVKGVLLNPLILGTLAGFLLWYFRIPIPSLLETPLRSLGSIATPLALFVLGASLDFSKARANIKLLVISVTGRLVVVPLIFLSLAVALGIRDVSLAALIAVYASPTSVSSFPMAQQMGGQRRSCGRTGGLYHGLFHSDRVPVGVCAQEPGLSGIKREPGRVFFRVFFRLPSRVRSLFLRPGML